LYDCRLDVPRPNENLLFFRSDPDEAATDSHLHPNTRLGFPGGFFQLAPLGKTKGRFPLVVTDSTGVSLAKYSLSPFYAICGVDIDQNDIVPGDGS